jgi:hypothetical protein
MESESPKNTGRFGKGNPGKPKGAVNHLTKTVKEAVLDAFNELQKDKAHNLVTFAKKNPRDFYAIAAKLIPTDIKAEVKSKILVEVVRNTKGTATIESIASESTEGD